MRLTGTGDPIKVIDYQVLLCIQFRKDLLMIKNMLRGILNLKKMIPLEGGLL